MERQSLERLGKYCHSCQKYGKSPGRFRFTIKDDIDFNYNVIIDVVTIEGQHLLHIVDSTTGYQNGRWLEDLSAQAALNALRIADTYLGPPDYITTDEGKNFVSKEFNLYAESMGIMVKTVPIEAHNSVGMVDCYHPVLRRILGIVTVEFPNLHRDTKLQMAFKAINDTAGKDVLVSTLLVFGAYPRMVDLDPPNPTIAQRAATVRRVMEE